MRCLDFSFIGIQLDDLVYSYNSWSTKSTITSKSSVAKRVEGLHKEQNPTLPNVPSQTKIITRGKKKNIEEESIGNVAASITKKRQVDKKMGSDSEKLITFI